MWFDVSSSSLVWPIALSCGAVACIAVVLVVVGMSRQSKACSEAEKRAFRRMMIEREWK